jgi:hypothetical protein
MKVRTVIAAASAVALISGGGALALAFPAAANGSTSHTLKFVSEQVNKVAFSKTSEGIQDKDVNSKGKLIGFDQLNLVFNPKTDKGTAGLTLDVNGGILIGYINLSSSSTTFKGFVTAGIGDFKGAFGTITGKILNKAGTKAAVTVTYSV